MLLRFATIGLAAALASAQPPETKALPTIWVVGDSTANNTGHQGWGDPFADYFDLAKVNVTNRARAGRSSRTFFTEGLWDKVRDELKPGDFVLIQFGHNDGGAPDKDRARGSLPGIGDESKSFTMPDGKEEVVYTFGWYIRKFIADSKAKGAIPMLLSTTVRNIWKDGQVERGPGSFGKWDAEIAKAEGVPFVDVTNTIADQFQRMGEQRVKPLFPVDHTHTSVEGADLNAALVVSVLKDLPGQPFAKYFSEKGAAVTPRHLLLGMDRAGLNLPVPANPKLPTLFVIGDSTVRNGRGDGANRQWGWGEPLVGLFDASRINVVNRAVGGLSSRTYLTFGDWDRVLAMLKAGDFVIMQFGHNDSSAPDDKLRARGTLAGVGEETREIDNPLSMQRETVHTYGWYLKKFIADTKAHGATPLVCSPVPRMNWKDGKIVRVSTTYQKWAAEVAASEGVAFVDLDEIIALRYDAMGPEKVEAMFADAGTHTTRAGAELNAECVVEGLKALKNDPLEGYFAVKGK
jgi:lysophospholipase L1-like esterase